GRLCPRVGQGCHDAGTRGTGSGGSSTRRDHANHGRAEHRHLVPVCQAGEHFSARTLRSGRKHERLSHARFPDGHGVEGARSDRWDARAVPRRAGSDRAPGYEADPRSAPFEQMIDIVLVGNIATCGVETIARELKSPHRLRAYPCDLAGAEILVGSPISRRMIEEAPRLRMVHASGAGCDAIAMDALRDSVTVCNVFHHE